MNTHQYLLVFILSEHVAYVTTGDKSQLTTWSIVDKQTDGHAKEKYASICFKLQI